MRFFVLLALPLSLLTACGQSGTEPGPGGVTVNEAKALDDAAAMLDERRLPPEALPPDALSSDARSGDLPPASPSASGDAVNRETGE